MTDLKKAAQQALETLEQLVIGTEYEEAVATEKIITALKAALEQPEQTCNCRWVGDVQTQQCTLHEAHVDAIHEWAERAKAAEAKLAALEQPEPPPEAQTEAEKIAYCAGWWAAMEQKREQPQQEQEPVVWGVDWGSHGDRSCCTIIKQHTDGTREVVAVEYAPSYTHPPRREWRGLKEWEINDGRDQLPTEDVCSWSFRKGVYFAEAALRSKNHD